MKQQNSKIKNSILKTIMFFDLFDYPLTDLEILRYLDTKYDYEKLKEELLKISEIENKNSMYFLKGRSEIYEIRMKRYNYADRKFRRAKLIAKIFKFIPWIKMIAIGNIIGSENLKDESDIDFFIISEKNRIWISRLFSVLIIKLLNLRPQENNNRDKICLSFFVSKENLDLKRFMIKNNFENQDSYLLFWLAGLFPIYDSQNFYKKLINENKWIFDSLPNWLMIDSVSKRDAGKSPSFFYRDFIDMFIGGLENFFKIKQLKIMPENTARILNKDTRVMADSQTIKLHVNDRREYYNKLFQERVKKL
jgi:hypothetical protein